MAWPFLPTVAEYHPTLDVYRDEDGNAVTITPEQCFALMQGDPSLLTGDQAKAVLRALYVWATIRTKHSPTSSPPMLAYAALVKSCLLGRLLYDGRPPMAEPPPVHYAAPSYHLVDPALCPTCSLVRTGNPGGVRWSVEDGWTYCPEDWHEPQD